MGAELILQTKDKKVHQLYGVFPAIIAVMTAFCSREILYHAIKCLFLFEIQISFLF